MRPEDLKDASGRRLSPQQIKDKFALEKVPKFVSDIHVPANTRLRFGAPRPLE
jgi:hypothetical protein